MGIRLSMRNYFSTNFLWTAIHTSRLVGELEAAKGDRPRFDMAHRSLRPRLLSHRVRSWKRQ